MQNLSSSVNLLLRQYASMALSSGSQRRKNRDEKEQDRHSIENHRTNGCRYRVIFKKVSFGIFRTVLVSKEEKNFSKGGKDKGLSLSRFS